MTEHHYAGKVVVKGVTHELQVGDDGSWSAFVGGERVSADTRELLRAAIDRHTRKATAKVAVPFTRLSNVPGGIIRDGVATGIHSRSRGILVRWDDGETEQLGVYANDKTVTRLSDEDKAAWRLMRQKHTEASRWLTQFEKDHEIKLRDAVREALDKAVSE